MPPQVHSEVMTGRLAPGPPPVAVPPGAAPAAASPGRPPFLIVVPDAAGHELVRFSEVNGRLVVTGDESRWEEGAARFLHGLMQWSGQVGVAWKDEVLRAVEGT